MARNDVYLNINALSPADAVVTGQQDMTAATVPELVLGDTPTFNFYFTDNTNVWPSWAGNASYSLTWALSDAVAGDFSPAATTGNATPITGGWSVVLPLNSYDLVGLLNTKRVGQPYPVTNLWQQLRVTDPSGNEITRAMFWTPVRYRAISDTQNTESASPTGGRFVTVNNVNTLTTPTAAQFYAANPVPTSALGTASNGELLIGNGTGFTKSTLTAGTGITVTNGSGSITIDASGAQETLTATVKNAESVAITKGQVVYLFGATGGFASVKLAYNTSDATSAKTFGVVSSTSIAANGTGTVTCVGVVDGLNLGAYNDGDTLYLGATPGSVTATKPYAPNHLVYVGIVERANNGNGELYVRVQNGYELDEIHDVQINAPKLAGQTLIYDQTNDLWKNARLTGTANQITVTNSDAAVTLSIPTNPTLPGNLTVSGTGTSTFGGNLTVSGSANLISSSLNSYIYDGTGWVWTSTGTSGGTVKGGIYTAGGQLFITANSSLATNRFSLNSSGDATLAGNLTVSGGTITGGTSGLSLASGGTNQNITLTPSGTGTNVLNKGLSVLNTIGQFSGTGAPASGAGVEVGMLGTTQGLIFAYNRTTSAALPLSLQHAGGNLLIGTTTDGGQKLQVAGTAEIQSTLTVKGAEAGPTTGISSIIQNTTSANDRVAALRLVNASNQWNLRAVGSGDTFSIGPGLSGSETNYFTLSSTGNATFAGAILSVGSGSNNAVCRVTASNGKSSDLGDDTTGGFVRANNSQSLRFITNSIAAITIDTSQDTTFAGQIVATKTTGAFRIATAETPASASATGTIGTIAWDTSYIYVCTAANTWKRVAIATW